MEELGNSANSVGFRIESKSWFLTYPKCPMTKEEVHALLLGKGRAIRGGVIARELHEDGTPHIHVYLLLAKAFSTRNSKCWDLAGYHGNYQKARSLDAVIKYISKDGDILQFGDICWTEKVDSRKEHRRYLGKRIIDGTPLEDIVREDPSLIFGLSKLRQDVQSWHAISHPNPPHETTRGTWILSLIHISEPTRPY